MDAERIDTATVDTEASIDSRSLSPPSELPIDAEEEVVLIL